MNDAPVVLGINRTQDASICLMHGSQLVWAIQKERSTRHKHHWGKPGDVLPHYRPALPGLERPVEVPVLLNTSFNGKDEPIVDTPAQALASFRRMPLHALARPPYLVRKRIEPELPE